MKKLLSHLIPNGMILSILFFNSCPTSAFETEALLPRIEILIPGMTRTVEITQNYTFPQDFSNFLIIVVGYGGVSITLRKIDNEGDLLILVGLGISSVGIIPVFKFGVTEVTLTEAVEIGDERSPYGLLWILSWVESTVNNPPYHYTLVLSY